MIKRIVPEGIAAGAIEAGTVALWFVCWDAARGAPLLTPALLGAALFDGFRHASAVQITARLVLGYSLVHGAAFGLFVLAAAALLAAADRQPVLRFGLFLLFCCFEVFALALIAVLAEWLLEALPRWSIAAGNVLAAGAMLGFLLRRHRAAWRRPSEVERVTRSLNPQRRTGRLVPARVFAHRLERAGTRGVGSDEEFHMPSQEARQ